MCVAASSCVAPRAPGGGGGGGGGGGDAWSYVVVPPSPGDHALRIEATFHDAAHFAPSRETRAAVHDFEQNDGNGWRSALSARGDEKGDWGGCIAPCAVRYSVNLDELTKACGGDIDCALTTGGATLVPLSRWLIRPEPPRADGDARASTWARDPTITLAVRGEGGIALGLRRLGDAYVFRASEIGEGSYTAFGPIRRRRVGAIDIAWLGKPLALTDDDFAQWVGDAQRELGRLFGRFPGDATLFVVPIPGKSDVVFGSVRSLSGASVALLVGDQLTAAATHDDWVLVHELFHLGTPTFVGEGRWLEEGMATYYEPIVRARAGWLSERDLWAHFADEMPRGLRGAQSTTDIEDRHVFDAVYWGGALFVMLADVRIRARTGNTRSFDWVLRAALARGGDATHVWTVQKFLDLGDAATGTNVLSDLYQSFARGGARVDLATEFDRLGVVRAPSSDAASPPPPVLRSDRPLSSIRAAISAADVD